MPFIHVRSLPPGRPFDPVDALGAITRDFARDTDVGLEHITATWSFLAPGHYTVGGEPAQVQPVDSHPVLVDLLVPDFNTAAKIDAMLASVATSVARHAGVAAGNVFVNLQRAHSGMVFDAGAVVRW